VTGVFANADDFGVAATYTPASGPTVSTTVLFNQVFDAVDPVSGIVYEGERLTFQGAASVFGSAVRDETVTIDSVVYYIMEIEPTVDGEVMGRLSRSVQHG